ncbi:MAG: PTS ascorbate transporter subunit IIC, partial [Thermoguttaceae bacterium]|nr:PTS ascorbate transporter subunit IIC [Thermoguttaceae bacterium]
LSLFSSMGHIYLSFTKLILAVLSEPALLVGLITLLGLLLQKASVSDVIKGTIKATLGIVVLQCGSWFLQDSLGIFGNLFQNAFSLHSTIPTNEAFASNILTKLGTLVPLVMLFGMTLNILIARFTPMKYIFLTGHHILFMAVLVVAVLHANHCSSVTSIVAGSLILGVTLSFFPFSVQWCMRRITDSDDFALGHFGSFGYLSSACIGMLVGKKSQSTEELNLPKWLMFFRETNVSIALTMFVLFMIVGVGVSASEFHKIAGESQSVLVFSLMQAFRFTAGIYIVLQGVRLILGEIIPAFKGISDRLVPNGKPALDCPLVFPFAPNAVILGFLFSFLGGLCSLAVCGFCQWELIIPGVLPHFFCGGTAGVFGNSTGGIRGCIAGAFVHGIIISFLPLMLLPVLGDFGLENTVISDSDFCLVGIILGRILMLFS